MTTSVPSVHADVTRDQRDRRDLDVLVIGSGAAGLAAALMAVQHGARRVMVAEAEGVIGGSSRLSGGLMMGAGTRYQRALGIDDDADRLYHDYLQLNRWNVEARSVRSFVAETGPAIEWVGDLGVEFYDGLVFGGDEAVPRVHVPIGRGQAVVDALAAACREADIDIAFGLRVDRLLVETHEFRQHVTGAAVGDDEITAHAVVMATGGFGNQPALLAEHFPSAIATGMPWYIGADGARGDGLALAAQVGAQMVGHDRGLRLLHAGFDHIYEAYLPGWLVLVNRDGRRFGDETAPYGIMDYLVRQQGDRVWAVFDHDILERATAAGVARYKQTIPGSTKRQSPHWNYDIVQQMVSEGRMFAADSLDALATAAGLPPRALAATARRYNESVAAGEDLEFAKGAKFLEPIATAPFYCAELRPATVCFTAYGMRVDHRGQVMGGDGAPIPGLFAAGECTGGIVGAQYMGSGNSYANCLAFGRIAGRHAAMAATHVAFSEEST